MNPASLPADPADIADWLRAQGAVPSLPRGARDEGRATWSLQRRCALTPRQFGACLLVLLLLSSLVALFFWMQGVMMVGAFAGIEMAALGAAFALHAVHGSDGERLILQRDTLVVESRRGMRTRSESFPRSALRLAAHRSGAIELTAGRRSLLIGREAGAARCSQVLAELRLAMAARA